MVWLVSVTLLAQCALTGSAFAKLATNAALNAGGTTSCHVDMSHDEC